MLVLSCFPGIGLLDMAFEGAGFCVVRGPDVIWGGDISRFHPPANAFAGVIGGPPCQTFSSLAHLVRANGHEPKFGNLIPEFERVVSEAQPAWFLMENVRAAPEPAVPGYGVKSFLLDNAALDAGDGHGQEQTRLRRFSFGMRGRIDVPDLRRWIDLATFLLPDAAPTVVKSDGLDRFHEVSDKHFGRARGTITQYTPDNSADAKDGTKQRTRRQAVMSDPSAVPVKIGGSGKVKRTAKKAVSSSNGGAGNHPTEGRHTEGAGNNGKGRVRLADALRLQGLPADFLDHCPFTAEGKLKAVANGVCLHTGRAIAEAVKEALSCQP